MHKLYELPQIRIEARYRVTHLCTVIGSRGNGVGRRVAADAISQSPAATLPATVVEQRVASNPEQPHARLFRVIGQVADSTPCNDHRLPKKVRSLIWPNASLQICEQVR